jgi:hypothetical protein
MPEQIALILIVGLSVALFGVILLVGSLRKEVKGMTTLLKQVEQSNSDMGERVNYLKSIVPKPDPVGDIQKDIDSLKERTEKVGEDVADFVDKANHIRKKVNVSMGNRKVYFVVTGNRKIESAFPHDSAMIGKDIDDFLSHHRRKGRNLQVHEEVYLG